MTRLIIQRKLGKNTEALHIAIQFSMTEDKPYRGKKITAFDIYHHST